MIPSIGLLGILANPLAETVSTVVGAARGR
jgi:hypothetical protein